MNPIHPAKPSPWKVIAAPAEAASSSPRRRRRQPCEPVMLPLSSVSFPSTQLRHRDWAALPPELISSVFHRFDPVQIMLGADKVCVSWRRAARDEPELWRRIDMRGHEKLARRNMADVNQKAVDAVLRSQGECQAVMGDYDSANDNFLRFLAVQAPTLKSLILISCYEKVSSQGFLDAIQMFPQLEELELSKCWNVNDKGLFEAVSKACPRLRHLRHSHTSYMYCDCCDCPLPTGDDKEAMGIATMHEIRSLQLVHNNLTNQGLAAILSNCPHLESLEIQECCNIIINDALHAMCAKNKNLKLVPFYPTIEYSQDYEPSRTSECSTCLDYFKEDTIQRYQQKHRGISTDINVVEDKVVAVVRELRFLELYHNDLTSQGLAGILEKFPHLESFDIYNCRNIIMNNAISFSNVLQSTKYPHPWLIKIKSKKLTIELLKAQFGDNKFSLAGLTRGFCDINMNNATKRVKGNFFHCKNFEPRRPILECSTCLVFEYFARSQEDLELDDCYWYDPYDDLEESDLDDSYYYDSFGLEESDHDDSYGLEELFYDDSHYYDPSYGLEKLDLEDSYYYDPSYGLEESDVGYYNPSYGLDIHEKIDFHVQDRMVNKRLRRYLKME